MWLFHLAGLLDSHPEICMAQPHIGSNQNFSKERYQKKEYIDYYNEYFLSSNKSHLVRKVLVIWKEKTLQSYKIFCK